MGIIGYEVSHGNLTINQIAIAEDKQGKGYGKDLLNHVITLENPKKIQAETYNDAVGFYQKLGFSCSAFFSDYGNDRYTCVQTLKE